MKKKHILAVLTAAVLTVLAMLILGFRLDTVHYSVKTGAEEEPFRIVFITDLHSCLYGGKDQSTLMEAVRAQNPDVVLLGGDVFDDDLPWDGAKSALEQLGKEFSCFYISGNHEVRTKKLDVIKETVQSYGITVLEGSVVTAKELGGAQNIEIYGFDDTTLYGNFYEQRKHMESTLQKGAEDAYKILLIHRPEYIKQYAELGFDLVLCGHAHGGQWRIPGVLNGFYAPGQGFFPKYAGGYYKVENTELIVSRGLARRSHPLPRIFNRPELVVIDIE